jgi:SAM-dependent methyltransferase
MLELHESQQNPFQNWLSWSETPLGRALVAEEQAWLDATLQDVFGYSAVQISPPPIDALRTNRMSCRGRMVWPHPQSGQGASMDAPELAEDADLAHPCAFVGSIEELPFQTESLDLLVLPHTLEVTPEPHQLLREAERVLIPEGKLVITGFNPLSLWALRRRCRSVNRFPPAGHDWISLPRMKDWLRLLNFDLGAGGASAYGGYLPPIDSERWRERLRWMDPAGRRWWPLAGGIYCLMAVKRVHHMRLITPRWRERKVVSAQAAAAQKTMTRCENIQKPAQKS